jgi:hypothetical protein
VEGLARRRGDSRQLSSWARVRDGAVPLGSRRSCSAESIVNDCGSQEQWGRSAKNEEVGGSGKDLISVGEG